MTDEEFFDKVIELAFGDTVYEEVYLLPEDVSRLAGFMWFHHDRERPRSWANRGIVGTLRNRGIDEGVRSIRVGISYNLRRGYLALVTPHSMRDREEVQFEAHPEPVSRFERDLDTTQPKEPDRFDRDDVV